MAEIQIQGQTISQRPEKTQLDGTEALLLQDTEGTKHAKASTLKTFVQTGTGLTPLLLDYSTIKENGSIDLDKIAEVKEAIRNNRGIVLEYNGKLNTLSSYQQNEEDQYLGLSFISEDVDVSAVTLNVIRLEINTETGETTVVENFTPSLTTFGEQSHYLSGNGEYMPLPKIPKKVSELQNDANYTTLEEVDGKGYETSEHASSTYATKTELAGKVSGTGVTSIQVVTELPSEQQSGVLYIVQESGEETA